MQIGGVASAALILGLLGTAGEARAANQSPATPTDSSIAVETAADSAIAVTPPDSSRAGEGARGSGASAPPPAPGMPAFDSEGRAESLGAARRLGMQDTTTWIPGITVRGTREAVRRTTATQVRLDRATLSRFLPTRTGDAMVSAPGVDLIKTGPWASKVSFRGVQGERVLVMVDDVRLNTGRGHGSNASLVSIDRLDEIELRPGSGGAEYGSDAIGGVVNLVTHRPLFAPRRSLRLSLSTRGAFPGDELSQSARLKLVSKWLGAELNGGFSRLDALVTPEGRVSNSGSRDNDCGARVSARLGEGVADLEYNRHAAHDVGLPALDGSYPLISRDATRAELQVPFLAAPFGWGMPGSARLLAIDQRYRTNFDESIVDTTISPRTQRPIAFQTRESFDRITTRSHELRPELRLGDRTNVRLGGELRRETTQGPKGWTTTTRNVAGTVTGVADSLSESVPHAGRDVAAASLSTSLGLGRLQVESGLRYDWVHSRADSTETSWTPSVVVTDRRWSYDAGLAVTVGPIEPYGRVASGFRAPNLEERFYRGPVHGGMDVYGDPDLESERSVTYEAGVRGSADSRVSFRVSAYRTYAEQFISLKYLLLQYGRPRFQYANLDRVTLDGIEASGRIRSRGASLAVSLTLPRARDLSTGGALTDIGVNRVTVDVTTPVGPWARTGFLSLRARWMDARKADPLRAAEFAPITRPAFWSCNAEFGVTLAGTRATLAVRNLFDHLYREPLSFIEEPGRTYSFALKRDFELPVFDSGRRPTP